MHEFSMAKELVDNLLLEAERNRVVRIIRVELEIGEVSFLQPDQLARCFDIIKKDFPVMADAVLSVSEKELVVKCRSCEYRGRAHYEDDRFHLMIPLLRCPECGEGAEVLEGRDVLIRNIEAEVEDE